MKVSCLSLSHKSGGIQRIKDRIYIHQLSSWIWLCTLALQIVSQQCLSEEPTWNAKLQTSQVEQNTTNRRLSGKSFIFLEVLHFPVTEQSCAEYDENQMVSLSNDFRKNPFFERWMVYSAIKTVIGSDAQITFKCVESIDKDDSDDPNHLYAGKFGSNSVYYLESSQYWMSIPTMHFENIYMMKSDLMRIASQNIFRYLNYLFYLAIFLTPAATGLILLLMKDLKSFYDYQGVVFSVFRYLNRQGDQQMLLWMNKILAFIVAIFFFFHYAILLSEMTALRIFSLSTSQYNRNSYRAIQTSQIDVANQGTSYYFLCADSYQYHFLKDSYMINNQLLDTSINHYNLLLSKTYFSETEYEAILLHMLGLSSEHSTLLSISFQTSFNVHSDDVFYNWLLLAVALIPAMIFYIVQSRFSSINKYTEIKSFREGRNRQITRNFKEEFKLQTENFLTVVHSSCQLGKFRQLHISRKNILLGKQVFRVIEKKRKKMQKHRRILKLNAPSNIYLANTKQNLYQTIKGYLELDRKRKNQQTSRLNVNRRKGIYPFVPNGNIMPIRDPQKQEKINQISSNLRRVDERSEQISPESFKRRRKGSHEEPTIFQSNKGLRKMSQMYPALQITKTRNTDVISQSHSQQVSPNYKNPSIHNSLPLVQEALQSRELEELVRCRKQTDSQNNFIEGTQIVNKKRGLSSPNIISKRVVSPLQSDNNLDSNIDEGPLDTVIPQNRSPNRNVNQFQEELTKQDDNDAPQILKNFENSFQNNQLHNFQDFQNEELLSSNEKQYQLYVNKFETDNEINHNSNCLVTPSSKQPSSSPFGYPSTPETKNGRNYYEDNSQKSSHSKKLTAAGSETTELLRVPHERHLKVSFQQ